MYIFHNADRPAEVKDSEGRVHIIPPNKAYEIKPLEVMDGFDAGGKPMKSVTPAEFLAKDFCKQGEPWGLVIVSQVETENGFRFDLTTAAQRSRVVRERNETELVETYVKRQKEEALSNRPVRPPAASIQRILDARGLDLQRDYGITPVGYKVSEAAVARDKEVAEMKAELRETRELLEMALKELNKKDRKEKVTA